MKDLVQIAKRKPHMVENIQLSKEDCESCIELFLAYSRSEVGITGVEAAMASIGHKGKGSSALYRLGKILRYAHRKYGIELAQRIGKA